MNAQGQRAVVKLQHSIRGRYQTATPGSRLQMVKRYKNLSSLAFHKYIFCPVVDRPEAAQLQSLSSLLSTFSSLASSTKYALLTTSHENQAHISVTLLGREEDK